MPASSSDVLTTRSEPGNSGDEAAAGTRTPAPLVIHHRPRPGRWIAAGSVVTVLALTLWSLWNNPRLDRAVIAQHLFSEETLRGVGVTLYLTVVSMAIGMVGGIVLAVMRDAQNPILRGVALGYQWLFRGTPLLVQVIFWAYLGALYPRLFLGIPGTTIGIGFGQTSDVINITLAAILALGFNEAAYASEIIRAGMLSVPSGQSEAATALGMSRALRLRRIVLPQAMRVVVPPMGNETISMLKTTSLVSVVSGRDLMTSVENVYSQTFEVIPLLIVASIWYLAITSVLSLGQLWLERHFGRGYAAARPPRRLRRSDRSQS